MNRQTKQDNPLDHKKGRIHGKPNQRVGSVSNAHVGNGFERVAMQFFAKSGMKERLIDKRKPRTICRCKKKARSVVFVGRLARAGILSTTAMAPIKTTESAITLTQQGTAAVKLVYPANQVAIAYF